MGCHKTKPASNAVPDLDYAQGSTGPAPEIENQLTSNPIVVENLPDPVPSTTEAVPMIQPPPPRYHSRTTSQDLRGAPAGRTDACHGRTG